MGALVGSLNGCGEGPVGLRERGPHATVATEEATPERQALTRLARAIALALGNDEFRAGVKTALQRAPFKEHKVELRKFLTPPAISAIARTAGISIESLSSDVRLVRPLELYMPVAVHRSFWTGERNLLVVSGLEDDAPAVGFDLQGREVAISNVAPPSIPTLSIVPVETRFDEPLDLTRWQNADDQGGRGIGTYVRCGGDDSPCRAAPGVDGQRPRGMEECGDSCGGGGGSYATPGLYMTFSRIVDAKEPWWKGDPEVEVHVHGPLSGGDPHYGADLACSGEHALPERYFDQNAGFWNGSVLLWTQAQDAAFASEFPDGYHVLFWEDDETPCQLKTDTDVLSSAIYGVSAAIGAAALKKGGFGNLSLPWVAANFLASLWQNKSWLSGNDDLIGVLVQEFAPYQDGSQYSIYLDNSVNGRAKIVVR
jgi:hypothetical protein